jgi:hypothetical protein
MITPNARLYMEPRSHTSTMLQETLNPYYGEEYDAE